MERLRVIQWATGRVGMAALRTIIERPDLELVGVYVSNPVKAGQDAGVLAGGQRCGVVATSDKEALYALDADVVNYSATDVGQSVDGTPVPRTDDVHHEIRALLSSGKNVVCSTDTRLAHPESVGTEYIAGIEAACNQGQSTFYFTGISPGVVSSEMALALSSLSGPIESIRVTECLNLSSYDPAMLTACGFGVDPAVDAENFDPAFIVHYWGSIVNFLAQALDVELDDVTTFRKTEVAPRSFTLESGMVIEEGTLAAMHWGVQGLSRGTVRISAENQEILHPDLTPEWYRPPSSHGGYRVEVKGYPDMVLDLSLPGTDPLHQAMIATAMSAINAIPFVMNSPPGLLRSVHDTPPNRGNFRLPGHRYALLNA